MFVQTASRFAPVARTAVSRHLIKNFPFVTYFIRPVQYSQLSSIRELSFFFYVIVTQIDAMKFSDFSDKWIAFIENMKYVLIEENF